MNIYKIVIGVCLFVFAGPVLADDYSDMKCTECHTDKLDKAVKHRGAVMGCKNCHEVHGQTTQFPNRLKDEVNNLCLNCHDEDEIMGRGKHYFGRPGHPVEDHPVLGRSDPLYPEREFTCVSCHNPHSSSMPKLFRYNYKEGTPYKGLNCAVCHWDKVFDVQPVTPPWKTPRGAVYKKDIAPILNAKCVQCHEPLKEYASVFAARVAIFFRTAIIKDMPAKGLLSAKEIDLITRWLQSGAAEK